MRAFGSCISIMQLFDCIWPFNMFSVPNKCRPCIQHTQTHSQRKKNPLLLCNDCVLCAFFSVHNFLRFRFDPKTATLNSRRLLSILQLKINELPDYRICGQSSSSSHCLCAFFLSPFGIAWNFILLQQCTLVARTRNFFCGIWLQFGRFWFTCSMPSFYSSSHHQPYGCTIRLIRWQNFIIFLRRFFFLFSVSFSVSFADLIIACVFHVARIYGTHLCDKIWKWVLTINIIS